MKIPGSDQWTRLDYAECLRPQETRFLLEDLLTKGQSINLIGRRGHGRGRTLKDLLKMAQPFCTVLHADLKPHRGSYANLVNHLAQQAGLRPGFRRIEKVFDRMPLDRPLLLALENLDYLADEHPSQEKSSLDPLYDRDFLAFLNNLKGQTRPPVHLLIPSEEAWRNIRIDGMYSTLELMPFSLEDLRMEEIRQETTRRLSGPWQEYLQEHPEQGRLLFQAAHQHPEPYELMGFLCEALQRDRLASTAFPPRIKALTREYDRTHGLNVERRLIGGRKHVNRYLQATGLHRLLPALPGLLKKLMGKTDEA